jgi:hypothetical protein
METIMRAVARAPRLLSGVVLLGALVACGTASSQVAASTETGEELVERAQELRDDEVSTLAEEVFTAFNGTVEQRNAGGVLAAYATNGAMDACMAKAGFPEWDWSLTRTYAVPADPFAGTILFVTPGRRAWTLNETYQAPYLAAEREMNADDIPADEDAAISTCLDTTETTADDEAIAAASTPSGAVELRSAWDDMLMGVVFSKFSDELRPYNECMSEFPLAEQNDVSADELGPLMSGEVAAAGPAPTPGQALSTYSNEWEAWLRTEAQYIEHDANCRSGVYTAHIAEFGPLIKDFAAKHSAEIERVRQGWFDIEKKARDLGYAGQSGPLGG